MSDAPNRPSRPQPSGESLDSSILRVVMDTLPDQIYFKDLESRFVRVNAAQARILGVDSPEACVGKTDFDFFAPEHARAALADEQEILRSGQPLIGKVERIMWRDGGRGWGSTTKAPWRDQSGNVIGTFGLTRDITAAKEVGEKLETERKLLRTIIDLLPARIYVKDTNTRYLLNNRAHLDLLGVEKQEDALGRRLIDFFPGARGQQALDDDRKVLATGESITNQEKSNLAAGQLIRWALTTKVPLHDFHGEIAGLVGISHDITRRKLMEQELQRRTIEMETDLLMARQVQEAFLPRVTPVFPRGVPENASALRFAHHYAPAATLGGDFFDIVQLSDTRCGILICDVMGHGVRAGLLTALIRGVVEELGRRGDEPGHVLGEINRSLIPIVQQTGEPVFASAFYGVVDIATGLLAYANAGHPAPLVERSVSGAIEQLSLANPEPATGLIADFEYSQRTCPFHSGDILIGYTDGLVEAGNAAGAMFGETHLREVITSSSGLTGHELIARLMREVVTFTGRAEFEDDICLLAVESTVPAQ
ncbi:MAG TPA: SpoIIE family protein phosphatase [Opitutus sp.]|nr:SpoIIE family protein phosphatase [Opitutus sp.]